MPNRTRQLAENALMLGIAAILLLLGRFTVLSGFALMVMPVPFILLAVRRTVRDMVIIVGTFAFLGLILAGIGGVMSGLMMGLMGAAMGFLYSKYNSALPAIIGGAGVFLVSAIISLAITTFVMGIDMISEVKKAGELLVDNNAFQLPSGISREEWRELVLQQIELMITLLPFVFVMTSLISSGLNHWLARIVSGRLGRPIPGLKPFREWSFPRSLLYYYFLALLVFLLFGDRLADTFWGDALLNVRIMLDVLFAVQGLSFCLFVFHRKGWKFITPVLIVSLFIFPVVTTILSLLGIFDLGIGLRKKWETRK